MKFIIILMLLASCSTNSKKARKFMEAGSWEKAREMWVLVLKKKPTDEEALAGKNAAEFKITNKYVIGTRQHREQGNHRGAMESALTIHNYLIDWKSSMDPDMAKYQHKELKQLYPSYLKIINESISAKMPLKASYDLKRFYPIFESIQKGELAPIKKNIKKEGKNKCKSLITSGLQYPFWRLFVSKACNFYGINDKSSSVKSKKISTDLYSHFNVNIQITNIPQTDATMIKEKSIQAFKESPWFHPQGKKIIDTNVFGNYHFSKRSYQEKRIKKYTENNHNKKTNKDPQFVEKLFAYYVTRHHQEFSLDVSSEFKVENQGIQVAYKKEHRENDWEYKGHIGTPRISRKKPNITKKSTWFDDAYAKYHNDLLKNLKQAWAQIYCQNNGEELSMEARGDYIIRCQRLGDQSFSPFITAWHRTHFGIDHHAMTELLGKYY